MKAPPPPPKTSAPKLSPIQQQAPPNNIKITSESDIVISTRPQPPPKPINSKKSVATKDISHYYDGNVESQLLSPPKPPPKSSKKPSGDAIPIEEAIQIVIDASAANLKSSTKHHASNPFDEEPTQVSIYESEKIRSKDSLANGNIKNPIITSKGNSGSGADVITISSKDQPLDSKSDTIYHKIRYSEFWLFLAIVLFVGI